MTRPAQISWFGCWLYQGLNGKGTVMSRNARRATMAEQVDGNGKCRFMKRRIIIDHEFETQLITTFLNQGGADQSSSIFTHEVDYLRCCIAGGGNKITFVFTIFIIYYDHEPAPADVFYGIFYSV